MAQEHEDRAEGNKVYEETTKELSSLWDNAMSQVKDLGIRSLGAASLEIKEQRANLVQGFEEIDKAATALHAEASQRVENLKHNAQTVATAVKEAPGHLVDGVAAGAEAVGTAYASADHAIKGAEKEAHDFVAQKAADGLEVAVAIKDKAVELKEAGDHKLAEVRDGIGHAAVQAGSYVAEKTLEADHAIKTATKEANLAVHAADKAIKDEAVAVGGAVAHGTVIAHQNAVEGGVVIIEGAVAVKDKAVELHDKANQAIADTRDYVVDSTIKLAKETTTDVLKSAKSGIELALAELEGSNKFAVNDVDTKALHADGATPANTKQQPETKTRQASM